MSFSSAEGRRITLAIFASLLVHALVAGFAVWRSLSEIEPFEFAEPMDLELGMTEEVQVDALPAIEEVPAPPTTPASTRPEPETPDVEAEVSDSGVVESDGAIADGGVDADVDADLDAGDASDAELDAEADAEALDASDAARLVAAAEAGVSDAAVGPPGTIALGPSRMPPGAMVAIRVDLARVRDSFFESSVRELINTIPEWQLLLEGSGVEPMDDFDRIFVATPNPMDFSKISIAGRHRHDSNWVRARAQALATLRGEPIEWTRERGIWHAPWYARDGRARIVAILGPHHFAVCRAEDLRRLLTLAEVRGSVARPDGTTQSGPDALLSMGDGEALSVEAENLAAYLRRAPAPLPTSGRAAVVMTRSNVSIRGLAIYPDDAGAEAGSAEWSALIRSIAPYVAGLTSMLRGVEFAPSGPEVGITAAMDEAQTRIVLGAIRDGFQARRERQHLPPPPAP